MNGCACANPATVPAEQAEVNCIPTHFGTFCPPNCSKCNPCAGERCDCPNLADCAPCDRLDPYVRHYEKVRYVQSCNLESPKSNCAPCDLTPPRRNSYKPMYICKTQLVPTHYDTVYRRSFDLPTYCPPPY